MTEVPLTQRLLQESVARWQRIADTVQIVVTVLGDGEGQPGFDKRRSVQEHLRRLDGVAEVTLPEDIHTQNPEAHVDDIERAAISAADVVICIEAPDHPPLGLYTEFAKYFHPEHAHRWYRIYPSERPDPRPYPALVEHLVADDIACIPDYPYKHEWWEDYGRIRAASEKRVQKEVSRQRSMELRKPAV